MCQKCKSQDDDDDDDDACFRFQAACDQSNGAVHLPSSSTTRRVHTPAHQTSCPEFRSFGHLVDVHKSYVLTLFACLWRVRSARSVHLSRSFYGHSFGSSAFAAGRSVGRPGWPDWPAVVQRFPVSALRYLFLHPPHHRFPFSSSARCPSHAKHSIQTNTNCLPFRILYPFPSACLWFSTSSRLLSHSFDPASFCRSCSSACSTLANARIRSRPAHRCDRDASSVHLIIRRFAFTRTERNQTNSNDDVSHLRLTDSKSTFFSHFPKRCSNFRFVSITTRSYFE